MQRTMVFCEAERLSGIIIFENYRRLWKISIVSFDTIVKLIVWMHRNLEPSGKKCTVSGLLFINPKMVLNIGNK